MDTKAVSTAGIGVIANPPTRRAGNSCKAADAEADETDLHTTSQPPRRPLAGASAAGATPNEMMSASESSSRPGAECCYRQRATRPSSQSKANANGARFLGGHYFASLYASLGR